MEIRTKIIDINYDEIWYRYKNESETFKYLDGIQKEEGSAEIALYKWILYLAYGDKYYNYTCNDKTFEEAVRRIYEAVYRNIKTRTIDCPVCNSGYSDANSLVNAINSGKQKWKQTGSSLYIEKLRDNNEVTDGGSSNSEFLKVVSMIEKLKND